MSDALLEHSLDEAPLEMLLDHTQEFVDRVCDRFTLALRTATISAGWPVEIVSQLLVRETDGQIVPSYPDRIADQVSELEYGGSDNDGTHTLHKFVNRMSITLQATMMSALLEAA